MCDLLFHCLSIDTAAGNEQELINIHESNECVQETINVHEMYSN